MSSANSDSLLDYFSLSNLDASISHFYLIVLAEISNTMLNKNGESGNLCLGPDIRGTAFRFHH